MASILQVPDVMSVVMGYVPEQWGTLAAVNWEGSRRANENGLELWERIARIPNVVFIAQHSAAIQSATTAKRKMKALGAILHNANGNEEERDLARVALENLGDHSTIFRGFGLLSDRVTNRYLLDSAIIHSDRTLFEAIDPEMFSPESI
ncbi:MAG TPA: hypothetical protein VLF94_05315, partial [Chlamydiales bacterium]|nr:hypothetical protein [Chlamydiales bacterium]